MDDASSQGGSTQGVWLLWCNSTQWSWYLSTLKIMWHENLCRSKSHPGCKAASGMIQRYNKRTHIKTIAKVVNVSVYLLVRAYVQVLTVHNCVLLQTFGRVICGEEMLYKMCIQNLGRSVYSGQSGWTSPTNPLHVQFWLTVTSPGGTHRRGGSIFSLGKAPTAHPTPYTMEYTPAPLCTPNPKVQSQFEYWGKGLLNKSLL